MDLFRDKKPKYIIDLNTLDDEALFAERLKAEKKKDDKKIKEIDSIIAERNKTREEAGLLRYAQLKDLKDLELKPYKYPGDKDPVQPITTCRWCGSHLDEKELVCHNCGRNQIDKGQPYQRKVPEKGLCCPDSVFVNKGLILNKDAKKKEKKPVDGFHKSDEFNQCKLPSEKKNRKKADDMMRAIINSCNDLAIDG